MSEVLSQSQIDMLLNAAKMGEMDDSSNDEKPKEKEYPKYDFYSPKKFTRDRLKMISSIFESYVRVISSRLNAMLHLLCELEVDSVEEQRYFEFSNALSERDVLTLVSNTMQTVPDKDPILFHVTTGIMVSMFDRMLGGTGNVEGEISSDYNYTDIELRLYNDFLKGLVENMGSAWKTYVDIDFGFHRVETNPTLVQLMGLDETVVIVGITMKTPVSSGRFSICLPGSLLSDVFAQLNREKTSIQQPNQKDSEEIMDYIRGSELEITAELQHTTLRMEDIFHLHVGDIIDLGQPKDAKVYLNIGNKRWFDGKMGVYQKNKAVKIDETYFLNDMDAMAALEKGQEKGE